MEYFPETLKDFESTITEELPPLIATLREEHRIAKENTEYLFTIIEYLIVSEIL